MDDKVSAERTDQDLLVRELLVHNVLESIWKGLALGYVRMDLKFLEQYECQAATGWRKV